MSQISPLRATAWLSGRNDEGENFDYNWYYKILKNRWRQQLIVENGVFSPVFVSVVMVLSDARAALAQADRFDAEITAG